MLPSLQNQHSELKVGYGVDWVHLQELPRPKAISK